MPEARPPVYLVGRTADLERDIAGHLGLGLDVRATDDPAEGWALVRDEVDAGRPPMVWADIAELEYLRVRMSNTRHDIVVAGYDEAEGVAFIADNDRDELQRCSLESLAARAQLERRSPVPTATRPSSTSGRRRLREPRAAAVPRCRQGRRRTCAVTAAPLAGLPGATGLEGVDRFAAAYATWPERFGDGLDAALTRAAVFIVKAGTGGAMFRSLHAGVPARLRRHCSTTRGCSRRPRSTTSSPRRGSRSRDAATALDHAGGLDAVDAIRRLEHEGVDALSSPGRTP